MCWGCHNYKKLRGNIMKKKNGITDLLGQFVLTCVMDISGFLLLQKLPSCSGVWWWLVRLAARLVLLRSRRDWHWPTWILVTWSLSSLGAAISAGSPTAADACSAATAVATGRVSWIHHFSTRLLTSLNLLPWVTSSAYWNSGRFSVPCKQASILK